MILTGHLLARRRDNSNAVRRLFQTFVNDFGPEAGAEIISAVVDVIGGLRISMPSCMKISNHDGALRVSMPKVCRSEHFSRIGCLYLRIRDRFGEAVGRSVVYSLMVELRGMRVSFPGHEDLFRWERDDRIRNRYNGANLRELSLMWGLTDTHIKRIVNSY